MRRARIENAAELHDLTWKMLSDKIEYLEAREGLQDFYAIRRHMDSTAAMIGAVKLLARAGTFNGQAWDIAEQTLEIISAEIKMISSYCQDL